MHILIPAGGRGVRLRPLTDYTPKPLLPLGDQAILTRIVANLPPECPVKVIVSRTVEEEFRAWEQSQTGQPRASLYVEKERASGLGGPVAALWECVEELEIQDDLLILMGDSLLPCTVAELLEGAAKGALRLAVYRLDDLTQASQFGVIELGEGNTVASFEEKPEHPRSPWIFMGCLYIPARLLPRLQEIAAAYPTQIGHLVSSYLEGGETVQVYPVTQEWYDIGTFPAYLEAHRAYLSDAERRALLAQGNQLDGVVYVHPTARVYNSHLHNCLVQEGAEIRDATLSGCVVHPSVSVVGRSVHGKLLSREGELPLQ